MKKNSMLFCVGETEEGAPIYGGVFHFYETEGVPLDTLFECIKRKSALVSWIDFYKEASLAGMTHDRILAKLEEAVCDVWGKEFYSVVEDKLNLVFKKKDKGQWMADAISKLGPYVDEPDIIACGRPKNVIRTTPYRIKPDRIIIIGG
jgi:hypothetical protein